MLMHGGGFMMKKITINPYQMGLMHKNGVYQKLLTPGSYWLWPGQTVTVADTTKQLLPPYDLSILLQDARLVSHLELIEVPDGHIALQYENGLLKQVLTRGRYAWWKGVIQRTYLYANTSVVHIEAGIDKSVLTHPLLAPYVRSYQVEQYEVGVLLIDGKYEGVLQGGTYYWWKNTVPVQVSKTDTRMQQLEINGQEMLTRDKATLRLNAWLQYRVTDAIAAILANQGYERQLYITAQLALRAYVGSLLLDELLDKRDTLLQEVLAQVQQKALPMGVEVAYLAIRDIILPGDVREIMNQVLVAEKKAQANSIMRREETASTRSLLNTAKLMEENNMLWKLKEMEYVEKIAEKISHIHVSGSGDLLHQLRNLIKTP